VVQNLEENIKMNGCEGSCTACALDWGSLGGDADCDNDATTDRQSVDFVIGSDIVCRPKDAVLLAGATAAMMKSCGAGLIILPHSNNRFGTEAFPDALTACNLLFTVTTITSPSLLYDIEEASYFTWHAFLIWHKQAADGEEEEAAGSSSPSSDHSSTAQTAEVGSSVSLLPPPCHRELAAAVASMSLT
jgi:hypothetical protein